MLWTRDGILLALLCLLATIVLLWYYPGSAPSGDAAYKFLQVQDFVDSGFQSFSCQYPSRDLDPQMRFLPFLEPFAYRIGGQCFYVFPFQMAVLNTPFYLALGAAGLYAMSLLGGIGILVLLRQLAIHLGWSAQERSYLLLYSLAGYGFLNYTMGQNEYTISAFLCTLAILATVKNSVSWSALAGLAIGLSLQLRAESAVLGGLLFLSSIIFYRNTRAALTLAFTLGLALCFFLWSNHAIVGHILGLRAYVFVDEQPASLLVRLRRLADYWALQPSSLTWQTPHFLSALAVPLIWGQGMDDREKSLRTMALAVAGYSLAIPLAVHNYPGPQFGERFLFNVYPILGLLAFAVWFHFRMTRWLSVLWGLAVAYTLVLSVQNLREARKMDHGIYAQSEHLRKATEGVDAVILRSHLLANLMFAHYRERRYFLGNSPELYSNLIEFLKKQGLRRIAVVHSKENYRLLYGLGQEFLPPGPPTGPTGPDLGTDLFELRIFKLEPTLAPETGL